MIRFFENIDSNKQMANMSMTNFVFGNFRQNGGIKINLNSKLVNKNNKYNI